MTAKAALKVMIADSPLPSFIPKVCAEEAVRRRCVGGCCPRREGASLSLIHSPPLCEQVPIPNHRQTLTVCKYHTLPPRGSAFFLSGFWFFFYFFFWALSLFYWTLWEKNVPLWSELKKESCQKWNVVDEDSLCDHLDRHISSAEGTTGFTVKY